jgi:subtilisin family serine protease
MTPSRLALPLVLLAIAAAPAVSGQSLVGFKSGTSMASPYAAGLAAMLKKQESDATYSNLRDAVRHKVDLPPAFKDKVAYDGRINAEKALAAIPSLVD